MFGSLFDLIYSLFGGPNQVSLPFSQQCLLIVYCVPSTVLSTENHTVIQRKR